MSQRTNSASASWVVVLLALAACTHPAPTFDAGFVPVDAGRAKPDAGDAGPATTKKDAGPVYSEKRAAEPCDPDTFFVRDDDGDGGLIEAPDGSVSFGICVAVRTLSGSATLNGAPVSTPINLQFIAGDHQEEAEPTPDALGHYEVDVLRGYYDLLNYHPTGISPTHVGPLVLGAVDMSKDQQRDLIARSHILRGGVMFAQLPFISQSLPPDVAIEATGWPPAQTSSASSLGGTYELQLLEGNFSLALSTPVAALKGTELIKFPLTTALRLDHPSTFDIDIRTHEVEGELLIDGQPFPDRRPGTDFQLDFVPNGAIDPTARTHHEGGYSNFHSLVPSGQYGVQLHFESNPDRHLPSRVYGKQLGVVDVTAQNQMLQVALSTFNIEGGIDIDGVPMVPTFGRNWVLYMYGFAGAVDPASLMYFDVPLDAASFSLRAFPGNYYTMVALNDSFAPGLVEGWYLVDKYFQVQSDTQMPISINTHWVMGRLLIDGAPAPSGFSAGTMVFRSRGVWYSKKIFTADDGTYRVRVPVGAYEIGFVLDRSTYPEYASGYQVVLPRVDLNQADQQVDLFYDTVTAFGPLRVGGQSVDDNVAGEEVGLYLERQQDSAWFEWGFSGGLSNYTLRIPRGDYALRFVVKRGGVPGLAWGDAQMGTVLPVNVDTAAHH